MFVSMVLEILTLNFLLILLNYFSNPSSMSESKVIALLDNIKLDYEFYITNQIMNPVKQVLDLKLDPIETEKIFSIK